jgi:DNA-binding response OmpR family regulator
LAASESTPRKYSVLLAEDDESIRRTLQSLLELKGYEASIAEDTDQTIAALKEQEFDLIISDYLMPGGGGREILRFLRERDSRPAVIMITGLADEQLFGELLEQGVDRCLSKPFRLASLLATIEELLPRESQT